MKNILKKPFILPLMLLVGVAVGIIIVKTRPGVEHQDNAMAARAVEVLAVSRQPFQASVTAYGNVEPAIVLKTRAELSGKVSYLHPQLKQGGSISAGTVVARIDPEDFKVSLNQSQADLAASKSSLKQLEEEEKTARRSLQLARDNLQVGESELARIQDIFDKKLISRSTRDAEQQKVIQLRQQVEELQGQINTYNSRRASINAQVTRSREQVKGQKTTLGRTEIVMPFDARIGEVPIEKGEFVSAGTTLFEALNIDGVEINAQIPIRHMRGLVSGLNGEQVNISASNASEVLRKLNLKAKVTLVGGESEALWEGRVIRMSEAIDPTRRTLGLVVAVSNPYDKIIPGKRPPLMKGMYAAVELLAPEQNALVIPRKAIHQGRVYLANAEDKLEIRPIKILLQQGNSTVIENGLNEGERVILNDLIPVIEGMPLAPQETKTTKADITEKPEETTPGNAEPAQ